MEDSHPTLRYFTGLFIIVLVAVLIWLFFYSGVFTSQKILKQTESTDVPVSQTTTEGPLVVLDTNFGEIIIRLAPEAAPQTAANFAKLVSQKFFDGLTFHRIIPGFVIQGGDPKGDGTGGPGYTVPAEIELTHKKGAVAMARLPDEVNPERVSSGSQFYIALQDLPMLDGQYTVFGEITEGFDVIEKIAQAQTGAMDKPLEEVIIKKAYIVN